MKKKIISIFLAIVISLSLMPSAFAAESPQVVRSPQSVQVNGANRSFEVYNIDGSNYFKLRDIAYVLSGSGSQFSVSFDSVQNLISVTTGAVYSAVGGEMAVGADKAGTTVPSVQSVLINGKVSSIKAYNIGGNNFFQLRELGTALFFDVNFDAITNTVLIGSSGGKTVLNAEAIYSRCSPAVFYIEVYSSKGTILGSGSGFFIDAKGTAVTNFHVIDGASSAKITTSDTGKTYNVSGIYDYSREDDWAVIKVEGSGFNYLTRGSSSVAGGTTIYAIGSPLGLQNTISQGLVSNPKRVEDGINFIQISAAISSGSSGGALINEYGEVIGITSASYVAGQNLNLALPLSYIDGAETTSTVSISSVKISDPIEYLKDYVMANGILDEDYDEETYGVSMPSGDTVYTIYYSPQIDELFLEVFYYGSGTGTMLNIILSGELVTSADLANHRYPFLFVAVYEDSDEHYLGSGEVSAPTLTADTNITFDYVDGSASYTDSFEELCPLMMADLLGGVQYMLDSEGLSVSIGDLGFDAIYEDYLS